jgi:8-oxo-dGTP pyrophosphatase MutT (NUDIX family)
LDRQLACRAVDEGLTFGYTDKMKPGRIRAIAVCIFLNEGKLLVGDGFDKIKQQSFGRPLGGTIEFGEYSQETIVREIREEIDAEITNLKYWGVLENLFTYNGEIGHEIVFIYRGDFVDKGLYEQSSIDGIENGIPIRAVWVPLTEFSPEHKPLYPSGLLEMIRREAGL